MRLLAATLMVASMGATAAEVTIQPFPYCPNGYVVGAVDTDGHRICVGKVIYVTSTNDSKCKDLNKHTWCVVRSDEDERTGTSSDTKSSTGGSGSSGGSDGGTGTGGSGGSTGSGGDSGSDSGDSSGSGTGGSGNRSGLGDGTNPGQGGGRDNSTNTGTNNPGGS